MKRTASSSGSLDPSLPPMPMRKKSRAPDDLARAAGAHRRASLRDADEEYDHGGGVRVEPWDKGLDPATPHALIYLRVSTDGQGDSGLGLGAQELAAREYARREGFFVFSVYTDICSGGIAPADRPAMMAMLADCQDEWAIIAAKRDRYARDPYYMAIIERVAAGRGTTMRTADGVPWGDDPADRLVRGVLDLFAEYERAMIRARTSAALRVKRAKGEYVGGHAPYGWAIAGDRVQHDPAEQSVIAAAVAVYADHGGLADTVRALNDAGHRTRGGGPWTATPVRRILQSAGVYS